MPKRHALLGPSVLEDDFWRVVKTPGPFFGAQGPWRWFMVYLPHYLWPQLERTRLPCAVMLVSEGTGAGKDGEDSFANFNCFAYFLSLEICELTLNGSGSNGTFLAGTKWFICKISMKFDLSEIGSISLHHPWVSRTSNIVTQQTFHSRNSCKYFEKALKRVNS